MDGKSNEWQGCEQYYDEDARTLVGMYNDDSHLYILLSSHDQKMKRRILGMGLTVWFDQDGGKEKKFGVRFPVGMPRHMRASMGKAPDGDASDRFRKILENPKMELQLLGPEEYEQKTMFLADVEKYGINTKVAEVEGNLIYELKVPLTKNQQTRYAIRTDMAKRIGVGFETGKPVLEETKERSVKMDEDRGGKGGGRGGKGGGRGGRGGIPPEGLDRGSPSEGMGAKRGGKMPESFELWTKVQLASRS
ncbi:MAG: hypothetical protein GY846_26225 [Deltaproteobacteria bacterium]|nr:hypothetical protein [Deltaproteobacteria bacterium]